jgi:hypothetical protein
MQEFVKLASAALGATEYTVRKATAAVLDAVSTAAPAADVQQFFSRLPGATELLNAFRPSAPPPAQSGVAAALGDLVSNATTAIQSTIGSGAALLRLFAEVGFDPQKAAQFAALFVNFAKAQAGPELVDRVVNAIPGSRLFFK